MAHDHSHSHTHAGNKKVLFISFIIITGFMIVEAIGGILTNSLALLADAGHMLSDSISLAIALIAFKLAEKAADYSKTYGYKRFEILAATINGATLIAVALYIFFEAIGRFANPPEVATTGMLIISVLGLLVNLLVAWIMVRGGNTQDNLNMRGAYLHVLSDMLGSIGAIAAALLILFFGWNWADPAASVIVAALILRSGYAVTKSSLHVLMEGTPKNIKIDDLIQAINKTEGVKGVHDLHVWSITSGMNALSCHVVVGSHLSLAESEKMVRCIEHDLEHEGISHVTIQMETDAHTHDDSILCTAKSEPSHDAHHH